MSAGTLQKAARTARTMAAAAMAGPAVSWMVNQSEEDGLTVAAYQPDDVDPDGGYISTSSIAFLAHPGDRQLRTYGHAMPVAAHIAAWQPSVAMAVAGVFEQAAADFESLSGDMRVALVVAAEEFLRCAPGGVS